MSARTLVIGVLFVIAAVGVLVWAGLRLEPPEKGRDAGAEAPPAQTSPSSESRAEPSRGTDDGEPARRDQTPPTTGSRERPKLPPSPAGGESFADEPRDPGWAAEREAAIGDRVDTLLADLDGDGVDVADIECRSRRCRMTIVGADRNRLGALVEALQGERGFYGRADQIMLGGIESDEGRHRMRATLLYAE